MRIDVDTGVLDEFKDRMTGINESIDVPLTDLLPDSFIQANTDFDSFQALVDASGIQDESGFESEQFSQFIRDHSDLDGWHDLLEKATTEYIGGQVGLGQ